MGLEVFSFFPISGHSWAFGRSKTCPHLKFGQDQPFDPFSAILRTFAKSGIKPTFATSDQIQVRQQIVLPFHLTAKKIKSFTMKTLFFSKKVLKKFKN